MSNGRPLDMMSIGKVVQWFQWIQWIQWIHWIHCRYPMNNGHVQWIHLSGANGHDHQT